MKQEKDKRRSFLKHILAGSAVVVGAVAASKPAKAVERPQGVDADEGLYKKSADFEKYYKSLR